MMMSDGVVCHCRRCGPCRQFTPVLSQVYQAMKAAGRADKFEVVFCSADHSEAEFKSYFQSMAPWMAIDYDVSTPCTQHNTRDICSIQCEV